MHRLRWCAYIKRRSPEYLLLLRTMTCSAVRSISEYRSSYDRRQDYRLVKIVRRNNAKYKCFSAKFGYTPYSETCGLHCVTSVRYGRIRRRTCSPFMVRERSRSRRVSLFHRLALIDAAYSPTLYNNLLSFFEIVTRKGGNAVCVARDEGTVVRYTRSEH